MVEGFRTLQIIPFPDEEKKITSKEFIQNEMEIAQAHDTVRHTKNIHTEVKSEEYWCVSRSDCADASWDFYHSLELESGQIRLYYLFYECLTWNVINRTRKADCPRQKMSKLQKNP